MSIVAGSLTCTTATKAVLQLGDRILPWGSRFGATAIWLTGFLCRHGRLMDGVPAHQKHGCNTSQQHS